MQIKEKTNRVKKWQNIIVALNASMHHSGGDTRVLMASTYKINSIWRMMHALISIRADIMEIRSVESYYIFNDDDKEFIYARAKRFSPGALRLWMLLRRKKGLFFMEKMKR